MRFGISTACFYPELTEDSLQLVADLGADITEIFFNAPCELETDFLYKLKKIKDDNGIEVRAIHPFTSGFESFLFFSEYQRRLDSGLEYYKKYFASAQYLGAKYLVLHGARNFSRISVDEYCRRFKKLREIGKSYGITVIQENVNGMLSGRPDFIKQMARILFDDVSFCLDLKQVLRADVSVKEMIDAMGGKIAHVHLSDYDSERDCIAPLSGHRDFNYLLGNLLIDLDNDTAGLIELYRDGYSSVDEIKDGLNKLKHI